MTGEAVTKQSTGNMERLRCNFVMLSGNERAGTKISNWGGGHVKFEEGAGVKLVVCSILRIRTEGGRWTMRSISVFAADHLVAAKSVILRYIRNAVPYIYIRLRMSDSNVTTLRADPLFFLTASSKYIGNTYTVLYIRIPICEITQFLTRWPPVPGNPTYWVRLRTRYERLPSHPSYRLPGIAHCLVPGMTR